MTDTGYTAICLLIDRSVADRVWQRCRALRGHAVAGAEELHQLVHGRAHLGQGQ
jgi:hypothetical protein